MHIPGLLIAIVVLVVVVVSRLRPARRAPLAVIATRDGQVIVERGAPPRGFIDDCEALLKMWRDGTFPDGTIEVHDTLDGMALRFSSSIPETWHQRFRNAWFIHHDP